MSTAPSLHHYNPGWLSDDDLVANFVARLEEFSFLRKELARAPREGSVQHYLLVGVRGTGKTTLLKRLAIAIRRDADLNDHLISLSFPEELYQVKHLADFWWAACEALADELDRSDRSGRADRLLAAVDQAKSEAATDDPLADDGLRLLLHTCAELERRPVLLVDNLDLVFQRIGTAGRKRKNPHAPAYWALREALSATTSPVVIGGSVRLSEPFTDYDKAFYDFFIPKRLGKLALDEVRRVLERLAEARGLPEVRDRLRARPGRIEALHELTGGNPRALGLIFELLRQGPNSRAVEDFERLMDSTTPYYKARFEDLAEQAQVVMHAMAVRRAGDGGGLRFGHTAAEIASHAGLATGTVSAQLDILEREGLVEKSAAHGRTQYRIAEQLFRLWLQMRGSRRIRQNVIGLTEFLEALFEPDELQCCLEADGGAGRLARAHLAFAVADMDSALWQRRGLMAHGAESALQHARAEGGAIEAYLPEGDLPEDLAALVRLREQLSGCGGGGLSPDEQDRLLGSVALRPEQKEASVQALCSPDSAGEEAARLRACIEKEDRDLIRMGLFAEDLPLLFRKRARGFLPLPGMTPQDADSACLMERDVPACRAMVWRLLGLRKWISFSSDEDAQEWLAWGLKHAAEASSIEWANVAGAMRRTRRFDSAQQALDQAGRRGELSLVWYERGALLNDTEGDLEEAERSYRKAIELDPADALPWNNLGILLAEKLNRFEEAEAAFRKAMEIDPVYPLPWNNLGKLLHDKLNRFEEAEAAYRKAIELDPEDAVPWNDLGVLLDDKLNRFEEAEAAYRKAIELDTADALPWNNLGNLLQEKLNRFEEAETAYRKAIQLDPAYAWPWNGLGALLSDKLNRFDEAEAAYRKAIQLDPAYAFPWYGLGNLLQEKLNRFEEAEAAYRKAIELNPAYASPWNGLGNLLTDKLNRYEEAEAAYRKAIELDPAYAWPSSNLGALLGEKLNRFEEAEAAYRKAIELDPGFALPWNNLGILLADKLNRFEEAEAAYRKAIELDPADALPWNKLGEILESQRRLVEAEAAYARGAALEPSIQPYWRRRYMALQTRLGVTAAWRALGAGNAPVLGEVLGRLLTESVDLAAALVSRHFVEDFLAPLLADARQAKVLLAALRTRGYDRHARPLLLAFEAALTDRPDMLAELEPEVQAAAQRMFERLKAGK